MLLVSIQDNNRKLISKGLISVIKNSRHVLELGENVVQS